MALAAFTSEYMLSGSIWLALAGIATFWVSFILLYTNNNKNTTTNDNIVIVIMNIDNAPLSSQAYAQWDPGFQAP